jgi:peptidoglycan/LPS O-acetylase OafA/YrhL
VFSVLIVEWVRGAHVAWREALSLSTFTRTYVGPYVFNDPFPVQHIWSLNVEEHCYLLLALVALSALPRRRAALTLICLSMLTFVAFGLHHLLQGHARLYLYDTECAATGLLMSAGYRLLHRRVSVPSWAPLVALALAPWFYLPTTPGATTAQLAAQITVPPFLLAFAVNHLGATPSWFLRLLQARWLRLLGVISYSVYMWQQPLYLSSGRFPWHTGVLCALLIGCASFYLYESPIRRWRNAHWAERAQPEQPASKERASGPRPTVESGETTPTLAARRMR